ncbi:caspase family protein [Actinomadura sp. NAK00032]|uniref:caspase, EACC1-associated type n=1 Tax=Actinomadura sp. NAK00032 TaxID=2742128 RepID=UPI00159128EA|nr:SAV_2336 N-terminal domain-related protein [Actinomadura sp. NAK00032]QKW34204.1 caspase family protein [Actinomadura sp. NAK00032]
MSEIDRLRAALAATGPPPDARELSEMLWLACHITPAEQEPSPAPPAPPAAVPDAPEDLPAPPPPPAPSPPPAREPLTGLHPRPGPGAEPAGTATEVLVPTAPMLADALGVQRALRPLKRRVPSRHRRELDEEATAARIADTLLWAPVLVPSSERWLTLSLVVDTGPTMRLWRPLARELTETLIRQGAFQNVHIAYLDTTGRVASAPGAPPQDPGTLLDASGRHAVLVLSDCSGPHWWSGHAARAVRRWAQAGPTAILQPLAERLWRRTAAPAVPGLASLPRPGAPNTDLRFTPHDGAPPPGVPVPVLEAAPRWFAAWARLVAGSGPQPAAVAALAAHPSGPTPVGRERELPIGERVRRFLTTASPDAAELAAHVAVSDPSLPVMRLIQHRILGGSGPGQLAEVLLSGLLRPAGDVRYAFVPGAREALLDTLPRPEALHTRRVLEAVSAEIERRAGTAAETFRALLPTDGGPVTLTADTDHFALVTPETRTHLAPGPAPAPAPAPDLLDLFGASPDELISHHWHGPPRKTLIGAIGDGGWFSLDILSGRPDLPHGLVTGPIADRDALLRAIVASLVLTHSPDVVNLGFANFLRWDTFTHLADLPHLALSNSESTPLPSLLDGLQKALEAERRRREAVLREANVRTWDAYQAALARGRPLPPLPALVVIIQDAGDLFGPNLPGAMMRLCEVGADQGLRFIFSMADAALFPWAADLTTWQADMGEHRMSMKLPTGGYFYQDFRPATVSPDAADSIVEAIRRRAPRVDRLHLPTDPVEPPEPPAPEAPPRFDVLRLNGGGPSGMFHETWALPASEPRSPGIGYDDEGDVVTLYPLDISAGIPHGLIVGDTEARRRVIRAITFSLAAAYSPGDLTFAFAGLGEHPLGEPLDLPHVRYCDEELLGSPDRLRQFTEFLSEEIEARSTGAVTDPPGLVVFADVSLTFPSGRPEAAEALLTAAQKGAALGIQLLVGSTTVEDTTIWDRFLPLLGWRVTASEQPPAVLRRVLGRPSLPFTGERTAYLRAGTGAPRRFTVAEEPPAPAVEDFVRRTRAQVAHTSGLRTTVADPRRSRAVLIGVSDYTSMPRLPAVQNNLSGLKAALCDPRVWGLPERNCITLWQPTDAAQVMDAVQDAASGAEDALLVYYIGHLTGTVGDPPSLALPETRPGIDHTALPYSGLRRLINEASPRHKVLLLDCSLGGRAIQDVTPFPTDGDTYVMASVSTIEQMLPSTGETHTAFTGELINLLERGVATAPAHLDMAMLHYALGERLMAKAADRPVMFGAGIDGTGISLFRNRAREVERPAAQEPGESIRALLDGALDGGHLVFCGRYGPEKLAAAEWCGEQLAARHDLPHGRVTTTSWRLLVGQDSGDRDTPGSWLSHEPVGGVLLVRDADELVSAESGPMGEAVIKEIVRLARHDDDPLIILCGQVPAMRAVLTLLPPAIADRFRMIAPTEWGPGVSPLPEHLPRAQLAMASHGRIPIGIEYGSQAPAVLDFRELPHFTVVGPPGSGKTNVLYLVFDALSTGGEEPYVIDPSGGLNDMDFRLPGGPRISSGEYAATSTQVRLLIDRLLGRLERSPAQEFYLLVDDHALLDRGLFQPLGPHLGGGRLHLVVARTETRPDAGTDSLLDELHPQVCAALLMGGPTPAERVPGRGVLTQGYESRFVQVASVQ